MTVQKGGENLPAGMKRLTGLYRFIPPESYPELGIDPEDVPIGAIAAEDHPPFLPDRFGGNAYGLGLYEQGLLSDHETALIETLDMDRPQQVQQHYRPLNDIFKSLGLLIRYTSRGEPYYLIPRQFVAHFLVEVQAITDEIDDFVKDLLARKLKETTTLGLVTAESDLLLPELQAKMPHIDIRVPRTLEDMADLAGLCGAVVVVGDPREVILDQLSRQGKPLPQTRDDRESFGHFAASQIYDMLSPEGEVLCLCEQPLAATREAIEVKFKQPIDLKRFLLFSHVYRTKRRYASEDGSVQLVSRFDFEAFITGLGLYHETVETLLGGRPLAEVDAAEIDRLPHQDLPLPRGSVERVMAKWRRWFGTFFHLDRLDSTLPDVQRQEWQRHYELDGDLPETLVALQGRRRQPPLSLASLESQVAWRHLAGCRRELLAEYKNSFAYVLGVLEYLDQVRLGKVDGLPGLELSRLRKPFENIGKHPQFKDVLRLVEQAPRLRRMEERLNPGGILGAQTPVLENLAKLSLMGLEEGPLDQLYLIVLGHSTMSRVTFGKLPEQSLRPLTDLGRYRDLDEAIDILRLYRLLSVAESVSAGKRGLGPLQVEELFHLYDQAVRVVTDPELDWDVLLDAQISRFGGVQAKATRKMLKIFNLFDHLDDWQQLDMAGPRLKEVMADFDPDRLEAIGQVVQLLRQMGQFVGRHYAADSTARPYFFRALLNSELHGSGRLLPQLGTAAGFTLLWICVNTSERRLINFNALQKAGDGTGLTRRQEKLRSALLNLRVDDLAPAWLDGLKEQMAEKGEAYILDSGLYLTIDRRTGALTPQFVDAEEELERLEKDLAEAEQKALPEVGERRLAEMDRRVAAVANFLRAQQGGVIGEAMSFMRRRYDFLFTRLEDYLLDQLFHVAVFAENLGRLVRCCPNLVGRVLSGRAGDSESERRLAAARKLSALHLRDVGQFQDMELSHEMARQEFGPATAGIVGVSRGQFQALAASLAQLLQKQPAMERLLMLAVLLHQDAAPDQRPDVRRVTQVAQRLGLDQDQSDDLLFLLEHLDTPRQIIMGEACLGALEPLLQRRDPLLVEALFLLSIIRTAARKEGLLTEDLTQSFVRLLEGLRRLGREGRSARQAHEAQIVDFAKQMVAFEHYREIQANLAPSTSLRNLLETSKLPEKDRAQWLEKGRRQAGLDRLLKLRGLLTTDALDILMLRHQVPAPYIYRLKGLRSIGVTRFERDLYEGMRLYRGLVALPDEIQTQLLEALSDPARPMRLAGLRGAAERLTYANQIRLLMLGMAAGMAMQGLSPGPVKVSFAPLAMIMERRFEVVNEAITAIDPALLIGPRADLDMALAASRSLALRYDYDNHLVLLELSPAASLERKIEAVRLASSVEELKELYHNELRNLRLTTHRNLDYQQRLEDAFEETLGRLGLSMLERVGEAMAKEDDLERLAAIFESAWEEGLELPLGRDRQQSLRDLFDMNVERLRGAILDQLARELNQVADQPALEDLWARAKERLRGQRRHLGKDFFLLVAHRFDRRAREIGG
ncbi:hypothetical protein [Desulfarculus baarsii]